MYDEQKELWQTLDELGFRWSVDGTCWRPKESGDMAPHMTELEAEAMAKHVLYRDDVRREERETIK